MPFGSGKHMECPPLLIACLYVTPELEVAQNMLRIAAKRGKSKKRLQR